MIRYRREGRVGWIHAAPYNGASSTAFCGRLLAALRYAADPDTSALARGGGQVAVSNRLHLGVFAERRVGGPTAAEGEGAQDGGQAACDAANQSEV